MRMKRPIVNLLPAVLTVVLALAALSAGCAGTPAPVPDSSASPLTTPSPATRPVTPTPAPVLPGDCNADERVTAADAAILLRSMDAASAAQDRTQARVARDAADITQNGQIDGTDARVALWIAAGNIPDTVKFVERITTGLCDETLFDRFSYTGVVDDQTGNYQSANVAVRVTQREAFGSTCFLADIYIQDIACLKTAFATQRQSGVRSVPEMAAVNDAVIAVNGDFCSQRSFGPIIRNGVTVRGGVSRYWDIALMTYGGELLTFPYRTLNAETLSTLAVYQSWIFGPELVDVQGKAKTTFHSAVTAVNPRTVLGYYAPGHYAFLVVDGRQSGYSSGLPMDRLAQLCEELGFQAAYNLDGGRSTVMATRYGMVNYPVANGRPVSDILYIRDLEETQ